jgi:hypothetical protein
MAKWCSITSLGTPGISDGVQANLSEFGRRKVMSALYYLGESPAPRAGPSLLQSALG